ncbi:hypothetical protein V5E97_27105 [Singulisphaera sp. Ch08]|uniref:T6SS immunity protein Tdi1 C-terminal domain-containing protein n=1 Tax=Singulisphaera sp. Ch08 TaxID=3120278 RepID=A0AAU7CA44_9BACT
MSLKPTWADLIIEGFDPEDTTWCLSRWTWLVSGPVSPVFLSKFGDWFLRRPDGTVQRLDILEGTLTTVASSPDALQVHLNEREWQEAHLRSPLVHELYLQGKVPGQGQCYAVAPPPVLGGRLEADSILVLDIPVWQNICVQSLHQAAERSRKRWWLFWRR